ncbi:MAG: hypothetical protein ACRDQZ_14785, partial [Mycobacteriales bacterium]
ASLLLAVAAWGLAHDAMSSLGSGTLILMLLTPLLSLISVGSWRWSARRKRQRLLATFSAETERVDARLWAASRDEARERRTACPDPGTVAAIAMGPLPRLWQRSPGDPDWLRLRVGLADLPAELEVQRSEPG